MKKETQELIPWVISGIALAALLFVIGAGLAHAAPSYCQIFNGCTGTSTTPAYGQVLVGGKNNEYELVATSTFGSGSSGNSFAYPWGTATDFGATRVASTTGGGPLFLQNGLFASTTFIADNSTTTSATTTNQDISGFLKLGSNAVISSFTGSGLSISGSALTIGSTAISNSMLANPSLTVTAGTGLNGGGSISLGSSGALSLISYLATSSAETAGQLAAWGSTSGTPAKLYSVATSSISLGSGLTNSSGTLGSQVGGASLTLKQVENRSFTYATTTWTGTTTIPIEIGYGELWNTAKCSVQPNGATAETRFYMNGNSGTTDLKYLNASSTVGTVSINSTVTSGATTSIDIGNPSGNPTSINCTINDTI